MPLRIMVRTFAVAFAMSCTMMRGEPAVRVDPDGPDPRWHANLATPGNLSGAVAMTGNAWMTATGEGSQTQVDVEVTNAAPGGVHPWAVYRGRCGDSDGASFGAVGSYKPLRINDNGTASTGATLSLGTDDYDSYYVAVFASPENRDLVVACGNFAPPVDRGIR